MSEILLINTKYVHNIGGTVRAAAIFDVAFVGWTGDRIDLTSSNKPGKLRLPREERLKQYQHVKFGRVDERKAFDQATARGLTPVAVEITPNAEYMPYFEHPDNALYVFGPEDGGLSAMHLGLCHKFVQIPSAGCTNLAAAVYITLYDRISKEIMEGRRSPDLAAEMRELDDFLGSLEAGLGPVDPTLLAEAEALFRE